jgi:DNA-binding response OmpR family regulator
LTVLNIGPGSVDGWLAGLVAKELGIAPGEILDVDARELVLDWRRVALTQLGFGVMRYLMDNRGKVASRVALKKRGLGLRLSGR